MKQSIDLNEPTPNVKITRDGQNRLWLCDASVSTSSNLAGQGCVLAEDVIYDRMFGG